MRYEVGRFRRPMRRSTEGQLVGLVDLGDGSTLSLDFTAMSGLDSRFTFSRASTATFINSSGLVQFANENRIPSSTWATTSPPSGWNTATTSGNGTFTWNGNGSITASTGASGEAYSTLSASTATSIGLFYTVTVTVLSVTGSPTIESTLNMTNVTGRVWYKNGAVATASTTFAANDVIGVSGTASGAINIRIGAGAWFAARNNESVTLTRPHMHSGVTPNQPYYANTTGGVFYDSARFDHDPATLQPRGLLIEGSATNVLENFGSSGLWGRSNIDGSGAGGVLANGQTGPDGVANTAARITTAATTTMTNMNVSRATNAAGNTRTFSVWLRGVGANTTASIAINGSNTPTGVASSQAGHAVTLTTSTSGNNLFGLVTGLSTTAWTRVSISRTDTQATSDAYRMCPGDHNGTIASGLSLDVYVPQAESGIGMTSTIPTGSGTVQRAADTVTFANLSSISFNQTQGTVFADVEVSIKARDTFPSFLTFNQSGGGRCWMFGRFNHSSGVGTRLLGAAFLSAGTQAIASSNLLYNSGNGGRVRFATSLDTSVASIVHSISGGSPQTATASAFTLATAAQLAFNTNSDLAANELNAMWLARLKYWPTRLPDAQLQALTQ